MGNLKKNLFSLIFLLLIAAIAGAAVQNQAFNPGGLTGNEQNFPGTTLTPDSVQFSVKGYPVTGVLNDTLFYIYEKTGAYSAGERASDISQRIRKISKDEFAKIDSITTFVSNDFVYVVLGETMIMGVSDADAAHSSFNKEILAGQFASQIKQELKKAKKEGSLLKLLTRIGLVILVLLGSWGIFYLIVNGFRRLDALIIRKKDEWLKDLSYKNYTFITADQELSTVQFLVKLIKWFVFIFSLYILLPIIFSIFPFTRGWAEILLQLIWSPFKGIAIAVWNYLPNLFSILVIVVIMRYFIRFVKYIFSEINAEKLTIPGFHADWAMPTFGIVRFLLNAFMLVLIFPYLPGSGSDIFKGISVFIGVLFSFGSSSAIANMVAGLVITYMRPFQLGDRIKIGGVTGDVIEKTMLVTRIKTIKNEIITIPNSSVLSGNTTNFSSIAREEGLIVYTTVTIGYDVPWKNMHEALLEAAKRTELLLDTPKPFVLQTSLDDFYVSYQINAFTREASKQAVIYSNLHQNIQDVCNERGIEILSPHYRAARDGNATSIPSDYLPGDYKAPGFNVHITGKE